MTRLKTVEVAISIKSVFSGKPMSSSIILFFEAHKVHCIQRIDDHVTDTAMPRKVWPAMAKRMIFVGTHSISLYTLFSRAQTAVSNKLNKP